MTLDHTSSTYKGLTAALLHDYNKAKMNYTFILSEKTKITLKANRKNNNNK